jgi:hypothetical protein
MMRVLKPLQCRGTGLRFTGAAAGAGSGAACALPADSRLIRMRHDHGDPLHHDECRPESPEASGPERRIALVVHTWGHASAFFAWVYLKQYILRRVEKDGCTMLDPNDKLFIIKVRPCTAPCPSLPSPHAAAAPQQHHPRCWLPPACRASGGGAGRQGRRGRALEGGRTPGARPGHRAAALPC